MTSKHLTVRGIEAIRPSARRTELPDGGAAGLYLVVQKSGAKSWAYRYRSPVDGRPRKLTIGAYPAFGLAAARTEASSAARSVKIGVDPTDERKAKRAKSADKSDLVGNLLDEFILRHVEAKNRPSTAAETKRMINKIVRPAWENRKVETITRRDVVVLLDETVDRGATTTANRVLALVRKFLNWCVERGVLESTPCTGVRAPTSEISRDRVLGDHEIRALWQATELPTAFNVVVRLLLLTGQRRGEVVGLTDEELNLDDTYEWSIPPARTKAARAQVVPLSPLARAVLSALRRLNGSALFFTTDGRVPISGWSKSKAALDIRMLAAIKIEMEARGDNPDDARIPDWRLHDLRRTAASGIARLGYPVHVIEAILNHKSGVLSGVAGVYNRHDYLDEKRKALVAWSTFVSELVCGRQAYVNPTENPV